MLGTKVCGDNTTKTTQDHMLTVKGLVLSLLVISFAIPLLFMVSEASPALAQPSVTETITGLTDATNVAYDPSHERMYVTGGNSGNVYIIDVNTNTQISGSPINIPGTNLHRIAYDPEHEMMYVTDTANPATNVYAINTNNVMETSMNIPISEGSRGIAYNPDNQMMYIVAEDNTVRIIDTDTNMVNPTSISLTLGFGSSGGIAYDPDHQRMYVTRGGGPGIVDIIDTTSNTLDTTYGPVTVGENPLFGIAYDPVHQTMYVSNTASDDVSVIDTDTGMDPNEVITTISGITHANGLAYDPVNEEMYVTEFFAILSSNVRVIDTNTNALVGDFIPVGSLPEGIAYEPVHRRMYVANFGSDSVSVIQIPQDPVTAIQDLITDIENLDGVNAKQSLILQLRIALKFVSDDKTFISCKRMETFAALVNTFVNRGFLIEAQADNLLQQAQVIRDAIGCGISNAMQAGAAVDTTSTGLPQSSTANSGNIPFSMSLPY